MGGWTCQYDLQGSCKLLNMSCQPGMKGCTINKGAEVLFTTGSYESDKKQAEHKKTDIDFSALARSN